MLLAFFVPSIIIYRFLVVISELSIFGQGLYVLKLIPNSCFATMYLSFLLTFGTFGFNIIHTFYIGLISKTLMCIQKHVEAFLLQYMEMLSSVSPVSSILNMIKHTVWVPVLLVWIKVASHMLVYWFIIEYPIFVLEYLLSLCCVFKNNLWGIQFRFVSEESPTSPEMDK